MSTMERAFGSLLFAAALAFASLLFALPLPH
jgi:hypothetical protein